jgi:hypothetical protein
MKGKILILGTALILVISSVVSAGDLSDKPIHVVARSAPNANIEKMESFCFKEGDRSHYLNNKEVYPRLAKYPEVLDIIDSLLKQKLEALNYRLVEDGSCDFYVEYKSAGGAKNPAVLLGEGASRKSTSGKKSKSIVDNAELFSQSDFVVYARKTGTNRTIWRGTIQEQIFKVTNIAETREKLIQRCHEFTTLLITERFPPREK